MGHYYHALPVQGGLVVLEENLPNVIQDINRMLEYDSNTSMYLNPNNTSEAMETLRREGFFIHEMGYGVCLKGWGANGDAYAYNGYPKNPGVIRDLHPEPIIQVFQDYSFKKFRDFGFYGLVDANGFANDGGSTVWTLQQAPSVENPIDRYPAKIRPGRRFEEVLEFCEEIRQETKEDAVAPTGGLS